MSCVDSVTCSTLNNLTPLNSQKAPSFTAELQAAQVKVSQSQTTDITIVTAEGDTVTLSSSRAAEFSFATYNTQGEVGGSTASFAGMSGELHRTSAFSMSIDGDLSREELKDIRRAIRTVQKAASDVLKGHEAQAASRTARVANLDQIASIDASLEFHREISVTQISAQSEGTLIPESTETSAPAPAPDSNPLQAETSETPAAAEATVSTSTASTHVSVVIQTQANSTAVDGQASTKPSLWWFPSPELWNVLYPMKESTDSTATAPESATPVPAQAGITSGR